MRTTTDTQQDILTCMDINIRNARTSKMREFHVLKRADYAASLERRAMRDRQWSNPMERFAAALCDENA